jgi:hypothetical protein
MAKGAREGEYRAAAVRMAEEVPEELRLDSPFVIPSPLFYLALDSCLKN